MADMYAINVKLDERYNLRKDDKVKKMSAGRYIIGEIAFFFMDKMSVEFIFDSEMNTLASWNCEKRCTGYTEK